jgi:hypothetical protein
VGFQVDGPDAGAAFRAGHRQLFLQRDPAGAGLDGIHADLRQLFAQTDALAEQLRSGRRLLERAAHLGGLVVLALQARAQLRKHERACDGANALRLGMQQPCHGRPRPRRLPDARQPWFPALDRLERLARLAAGPVQVVAAHELRGERLYVGVPGRGLAAEQTLKLLMRLGVPGGKDAIPEPLFRLRAGQHGAVHLDVVVLVPQMGDALATRQRNSAQRTRRRPLAFQPLGDALELVSRDLASSKDMRCLDRFLELAAPHFLHQRQQLVVGAVRREPPRQLGGAAANPLDGVVQETARQRARFRRRLPEQSFEPAQRPEPRLRAA